MAQKEIAMFNEPGDYQDSELHKDILRRVQTECKGHLIEKKELDQIGRVKYISYRPIGSVSIRKVLKSPHFSAKS